ncbi:hypothetical protein HYV50_05425 [Candidatus Pacearchaeota archaeon]|nr:hypothetical protein [Candidatus Pacearchaeota archaeon]
MKIKKNKNEKSRKNNLIYAFGITILLIFFANVVFVNAEGERVGTLDRTVCCEKTKSGLFCQDVKEEQCATADNPPTSCVSVSSCKPGFCFDSFEGTCLDNTPQMVCNENKGTWFAEKPAQCELGCCVLGDQGSFVTLTRCKKMSGDFGLETNFNPDIKDETECILTAGSRERGACVFNEDFEKTCKLTTRQECAPENILGGSGKFGIVNETQNRNLEGLTPAGSGNEGTGSITGQAISDLATNEVKFYSGKLCTAEELGTNCAMTKETICIPGKEEVYFVDTCGNPGNVYDASKINDKEYWANIKDKSEICGPDSGNENSQTCGNCNYLFGTFCRASNSKTARPTYGTNICASLNCVDDEGNEKLHGESWCLYDGGSGVATAATGAKVGSKFYRQICNNGEILTEPCADFRQEECIENNIDTPQGRFSEAACRVNRWQDCTAQRSQRDCENSDKRDCKWFNGIGYVLMGSILNGSSLDDNSLASARQRASGAIQAQGGLENIPRGACVPKVTPGLNFWTGDEARGICAQANAICPVTYEKKAVGGGDWKCVKNCECDPNEHPEVLAQRLQLCMSLGDCGPKVNWVGDKGYNIGYDVTKRKVGD